MNLTDKLSCDRSVSLAADSIAKLREPDVMRVIEDYANYNGGDTKTIVQYIAENRPDLAREASDCAGEITHVAAMESERKWGEIVVIQWLQKSRDRIVFHRNDGSWKAVDTTSGTAGYECEGSTLGLLARALTSKGAA